MVRCVAVILPSSTTGRSSPGRFLLVLAAGVLPSFQVSSSPERAEKFLFSFNSPPPSCLHLIPSLLYPPALRLNRLAHFYIFPF
ncbi:hypothetical protein M752DRAFT_140615 [Aspergillus phoenicis ATCC 13157]|uniref:Uncharacterized protein n=2 Tax=Aspergillus TaxID=5052 RepID=A0A370PQQ4_ASPPH|nr:hypothetical protein M747DRAFT_21634 [Aspergillus niger ATCC 13496]RDK44491.1 hypothetical protein M752DRAFT_140615 [Aspergillus phoenicis ATCC 13157]